MRIAPKRDFPVGQAWRVLEPRPVLLVSSRWKGQANVMTMSWYAPMEFTPALVGCVISDRNHSFELIRKSKECVLNVPSAELAATVARVGNCSGRDTDKFAELRLTAVPGEKVKAPLVDECHASFECRLADTSLVRRYAFFVFEIVKAHARPTPRQPRTLHYQGDGEFVLSGPVTRRYRRLFRPEML